MSEKTSKNKSKTKKIISLLIVLSIIFFISAFLCTTCTKNTTDIKTNLILQNYTNTICQININDQTGNTSAIGTGIVIDSNGHIITNEHVITNKVTNQRSNSITITVNANTYNATIIGADNTKDIAVLQVEEKLTPAIIGNSDTTMIGEKVYTIGSPLGLNMSISEGIISGKDRTEINTEYKDTKVYTNMIQTDAAINPGSSGGALIDSNGTLIGINSLIISTSGMNSGIGFAIPINKALEIANTIIETNKDIEHIKLGIKIATTKPTQENQIKGAEIIEITPNSIAESMELKIGDIITQINNTPIESSDGVIAAVSDLKYGDYLEIKIIRSNTELTLNKQL